MLKCGYTAVNNIRKGVQNTSTGPSFAYSAPGSIKIAPGDERRGQRQDMYEKGNHGHSIL